MCRGNPSFYVRVILPIPHTPRTKVHVNDDVSNELLDGLPSGVARSEDLRDKTGLMKEPVLRFRYLMAFECLPIS